MVATQQEEILGVFDLVGQQEADGFQRLLPSVHVVTQKQVVTLGGEATVLEEPQQVVILTVDVTCTMERRGQSSILGNSPDKHIM